MASTEKNSFHKKDKFSLKRTISTRRNGFYLKEGFPLKGMASTYGFQ